MMRPRRIPRARWTWVVPAIVAAVGCDESINPFQATDLAYSIFGHLDAAADTQWIRVTPFRTSIFSTPDPVDAVVTIEDLGTGRMIELIPTLYRQGSGNFEDSLFAYNFRTEERIDYGATYRLTARRSDGATASATVRIPEDLSHLPSHLALTQRTFRNQNDSIRFPAATGDYVAMVHTIHHVPDSMFVPPDNVLPYPCAHFPSEIVHHSGEAFVGSGSDYRRGILYDLDGVDDCTVPLPFERKEVRIIRTREAWPFAGSADNSHINAVNNIENGVGFLGGVVTTVLPYPVCTLSGSSFPDFCNMILGPGSATLIVSLVDETPVAEREDGFGPELFLQRVGETWRRSVGRSPSWSWGTPAVHRFEGLFPGTYHLRVDSQFEGEATLYCEERTLVIEPGEGHVEIRMVRISDFFPNEPVNANGCREG